jgi:hypothetical protein
MFLSGVPHNNHFPYRKSLHSVIAHTLKKAPVHVDSRPMPAPGVFANSKMIQSANPKLIQPV